MKTPTQILKDEEVANSFIKQIMELPENQEPYDPDLEMYKIVSKMINQLTK